MVPVGHKLQEDPILVNPLEHEQFLFFVLYLENVPQGGSHLDDI
jgi:hypothetical protein